MRRFISYLRGRWLDSAVPPVILLLLALITAVVCILVGETWLAAADVADAPAPAPLADQSSIIIAVPQTVLNLRAGPGTGFALRRVLAVRERLTVLGQNPQGDWFYVRAGDGLEGWVLAAYLTLSRATAGVAAPAQPAPVQPALSQAAPVAAPVASGGGITAIGDSIMLGASDELRRDLGSVSIDAAVGRQVSQAIAVLQAKQAAGALGNVILIHIGTNGTFTADQFDTIMRLAGGRRVVFVNIKAGRSWQDGNNSLLWSKVQQYPNASLVDWYSASINHPEYFAGDGIHPSAAGIRAYGNLIASRVPR
ncbi:MAG: SH3 domain-containing protein [Anaerolineae bacterium]